MISNYPELNKRSIFTTESVLPDECKHLDGTRCWWNLLMHSRLFKAPKARSRHQQSVLSMVILTFGYSVEINERISLTFTVFSTSLYIWNPSLINSLYKRDQGIPLMARLTWICRSYSQQPKSTTHGRHIWSSKYVMYDSSFVNFFLVSRSFQFRVREGKGCGVGGGVSWCQKYHLHLELIFFFFKITPQTVYASTKRNDIPSLRSRRLEVVGTSSLFRPLLPSACYAGYDITRGTRVVTSLPGCIYFPCCLRGVSLFLNTGCLEPFRSNKVQTYVWGYVFLSAAV